MRSSYCTQVNQANTAIDRAYRPTISEIPAASTLRESLGLGSSHHSKAQRARGISRNPVAATLSRLRIKIP